MADFFDTMMARQVSEGAGGTIQRVAGAIGALQRLQIGAAELEEKGLRRQLLERELEGPSEREQYLEKQRSEQVKLVLTTFSQLSKESSLATKSILMEHMQSLWGAMTPFERTASKMVYEHSPLNPIAQKAAWWDQTMPAPKVTADPKVDLYAYTEQVFHQDDYFQQRQNFISGVPIQRLRIKPIGEGVFGIRGEDGKVGVMTSDDLQLDQTAKELNTTMGALVASNGVHSFPPREIAIGDNVFKVTDRYDAIGRKKLSPSFVPVKGGKDNLPGEEKRILDFAVAFGIRDDSGKTDGSRLYKEIMARRDEGKDFGWISKVILEPRFPGYHFALVDPGKMSGWPIWGGYAPSDTETLTYWRGEITGLPTKDGRLVEYYYDGSKSQVFDPEGRMVSNSLPEWAGRIASKTMDELQAEASGKVEVKGKPSAPVPKPKLDSVKAKADKIKNTPPKEDLTIGEVLSVLLTEGWTPELASTQLGWVRILGPGLTVLSFAEFQATLAQLHWTNEQLWKVYKGTWNALNTVGDWMIGLKDVKVPGTKALGGEK